MSQIGLYIAIGIVVLLIIIVVMVRGSSSNPIPIPNPNPNPNPNSIPWTPIGPMKPNPNSIPWTPIGPMKPNPNSIPWTPIATDIYYIDPAKRTGTGFVVVDTAPITCPNSPDCGTPSSTVWDNTVKCPNSTSTTACITDFQTASQICSLTPSCVGVLLNGGDNQMTGFVGNNGTINTIPYAQPLTIEPNQVAGKPAFDAFWLPRDTTLTTAPVGTLVPQLVDSAVTTGGAFDVPADYAYNLAGYCSTNYSNGTNCLGFADNGFSSGLLNKQYIEGHMYTTPDGMYPLTSATPKSGITLQSNLGMQYVLNTGVPVLPPFTGWSGNSYVLNYDQPNSWYGIASADTAPITCNNSLSSTQCITDLASAGAACDADNSCIGIIYNILSTTGNGPVAIPVNTTPTSVPDGTNPMLGGGAIFLTPESTLTSGDVYGEIQYAPSTTIPNTVLKTTGVSGVNGVYGNGALLDCQVKNNTTANTCGGVLMPDYTSLYQYQNHVATQFLDSAYPYINAMEYDKLNTGQTNASNYLNAISITYETK